MTKPPQDPLHSAARRVYLAKHERKIAKMAKKLGIHEGELRAAMVEDVDRAYAEISGGNSQDSPAASPSTTTVQPRTKTPRGSPTTLQIATLRIIAALGGRARMGPIYEALVTEKVIHPVEKATAARVWHIVNPMKAVGWVEIEGPTMKKEAVLTASGRAIAEANR